MLGDEELSKEEGGRNEFYLNMRSQDGPSTAWSGDADRLEDLPVGIIGMSLQIEDEIYHGTVGPAKYM